MKSIFVGFGRILEPSWDPRSTQNGRKTVSKNRTIFRRSWLGVRRPAVLGVCLASLPWRPPIYARALFPKQTGQDEEGREKREEGRKEERKKGRRGKKDKREEKSIQDLTRQGPEARRIFSQNRFFTIFPTYFLKIYSNSPSNNPKDC